VVGVDASVVDEDRGRAELALAHLHEAHHVGLASHVGDLEARARVVAESAEQLAPGGLVAPSESHGGAFAHEELDDRAADPA